MQIFLSNELGEGKLNDSNDNVTMPNKYRIKSLKQSIHYVFPNLENGKFPTSHCLLSTTNEIVQSINDQVMDKFDSFEKFSYSVDTNVTDGDATIYPQELLNNLNISGFPPHKLRLKIGCVYVLIRNINPSVGLMNGTRLILRNFKKNMLYCKIITPPFVGEHCFLPRITMICEDEMRPYDFKRHQFPILPAAAPQPCLYI